MGHQMWSKIYMEVGTAASFQSRRRTGDVVTSVLYHQNDKIESGAIVIQTNVNDINRDD